MNTVVRYLPLLVLFSFQQAFVVLLVGKVTFNQINQALCALPRTNSSPKVLPGP